jgi:hypothetical protein
VISIGGQSALATMGTSATGSERDQELEAIIQSRPTGRGLADSGVHVSCQIAVLRRAAQLSAQPDGPPGGPRVNGTFGAQAYGQRAMTGRLAERITAAIRAVLSQAEGTGVDNVERGPGEEA